MIPINIPPIVGGQSAIPKKPLYTYKKVGLQCHYEAVYSQNSVDAHEIANIVAS